MLMVFCCVFDSFVDFMKNLVINKVFVINWELEYFIFYEWRNIVNVKNEWESY